MERLGSPLVKAGQAVSIITGTDIENVDTHPNFTDARADERIPRCLQYGILLSVPNLVKNSRECIERDTTIGH